MATKFSMPQGPSLETRLSDARKRPGRPNLPNWFTFPEAMDGDEPLFLVSNMTAHLFVLYCEYVMGDIENSLGKAPKPDEQEKRFVSDIWVLHLKGIVERYLGHEVSDQELARYEIRSGWYLVRTNVPADLQAKVDAASK